MDEIEQLREHWNRLGCLNKQTADAADVRAFEDRYGIKLPPLVREYFMSLNGTRDGKCGMEDEDMISFWHLNQVRTLAEECPGDPTPNADRLFVFADWIVWSYGWAFELGEDASAPAAVFVTYDPALRVASSFEEFLRKYVARDSTVLFPTYPGAPLSAGLD